MAQTRNRSRGWCFTINNYKNSDLIEFYEANADYGVFGFETGSEGIPHMQGYLYWINPIEFTTVKSYLTRAHIEKQRARDPAAAIKYCEKDGEVYEYGNRPDQGRRSDLQDLTKRVLAGESLSELVEDYPSQVMMYKSKLEELTNMRKPTNDECNMMIFKSDKDIIEFCQSIYQNVLYCEEERDLFEYDDTYDAVCMCGMMSYIKLGQLARNLPLIVRNGYKTKKILPKVFIYRDPYFSTNSEIIDYVTIIRPN